MLNDERILTTKNSMKRIYFFPFHKGMVKLYYKYMCYFYLEHILLLTLRSSEAEARSSTSTSRH